MIREEQKTIQVYFIYIRRNYNTEADALTKLLFQGKELDGTPEPQPILIKQPYIEVHYITKNTIQLLEKIEQINEINIKNMRFMEETPAQMFKE